MSRCLHEIDKTSRCFDKSMEWRRNRTVAAPARQLLIAPAIRPPMASTASTWRRPGHHRGRPRRRAERIRRRVAADGRFRPAGSIVRVDLDDTATLLGLPLEDVERV